MFNRITKVLQAMSLSVLVFLSGQMQVSAGVLSLSQTPLFLGASIQPNVFFMMDDSGSMDWEHLVGAYRPYIAYDPDPRRNGSYSSGSINTRYTDGYMRSYRDDNLGGDFGLQLYMYINTGNLYGRTDCRNNSDNYSRESCTGTSVYTADWRLRSNGFNRIWYTPNIEYKPWFGPCLNNGSDCTDADFFNARSNPRQGETGYTELRDLSVDGSGDHAAYVYDIWVDDAGYAGAHPHRGTNQNYTVGANKEVDLWDTHLRFVVGANNIRVTRVSYAPANTTGLNEAETLLANLNSAVSCYDLLGAINTSAIPLPGAINGASCRTIAQTQMNIANWYQYNRKRVYSAKSAISTVMTAQPSFRYGISLFKESNSFFVEVPDSTVSNTSIHNLQLKDALFKHDQNGFVTPLREGLNLAGRYFENSLGKVDPILFSCQKNFTILLTDGYWTDTTFNFGDKDGDGVADTAADVAYEYYFKDLSAKANNVKVDVGEDDIDPDGNKLTFQHMVTFTVAFGVEGKMTDTNGDGWPDLDSAGNAWGTSDGLPNKNGNWGNVSNDAEKIDDIWHAAYNSNGVYASASSAAEVAEKLIDAISNIAGRIGSASAVALNSGTLNANSRVYQAKFDSNDWTGALVSIPIQSGQLPTPPATTTCSTEALGELCPQEWNAADKLESMSFGARKVYSYNTDTGLAVAFKTLTDLGLTQQTALRTHPDTGLVQSLAVGQDRLDYVLGDNSREGLSSADFRVRKTTTLGTGKLGDIIHSSPAFSGAPNSFYPDFLEGAGNSYTAFRLANKSRTPMVYVGANDGMLHAFKAADGTEKFAYVPGALVGKLNQLSSQSYTISHTYFADGSPKVFDAFDGSAWKTILASSVGAGGQMVFALDVTNPDAFTTSSIKWEFSDQDDADLGYTIGDVAFAKMNNGQWVVIFGNGYNNTAADSNVSSTGNAAIYIVDAFTGALVSKFNTGVGTANDPLNPGSDRPNGMAQITPVDIDGDFKVDYLYGGDLFGNVWKIDTTATSSSAWDFANKSGGTPKPFFIAKDNNGDVQTITSAVAVKRHPEKSDQTLVMFGTGKYIEVGDSAIPTGGGQIQTFYGIWDDNTAAQYGRSNLLQQEILSEKQVTGSDGIVRDFRVTSSSEQPAYKIDWALHKGWYMDLRYGISYGERMVVEPVIRNNRVIFVTLIPDEDPCASGGDGWIMELEADSGSRLPVSPFDVNGDGLIDSNDFVNYNSDNTIISGVKSRSGIVAKPGILNNPTGSGNNPDEFKYFSGTSGKVDVVSESSNKDSKKRQSWRQQR